MIPKLIGAGIVGQWTFSLFDNPMMNAEMPALCFLNIESKGQTDGRECKLHKQKHWVANCWSLALEGEGPLICFTCNMQWEWKTSVYTVIYLLFCLPLLQAIILCQLWKGYVSVQGCDLGYLMHMFWWVWVWLYLIKGDLVRWDKYSF